VKFALPVEGTGGPVYAGEVEVLEDGLADFVEEDFTGVEDGMLLVGGLEDEGLVVVLEGRADDEPFVELIEDVGEADDTML